ncbi:unnamed protein product [Rhizophagus irregularis]|nr:unnamed protein product [Rhizophagus irregularis]
MVVITNISYIVLLNQDQYHINFLERKSNRVARRPTSEETDQYFSNDLPSVFKNNKTSQKDIALSLVNPNLSHDIKPLNFVKRFPESLKLSYEILAKFRYFGISPTCQNSLVSPATLYERQKQEEEIANTPPNIYLKIDKNVLEMERLALVEIRNFGHMPFG